MELYGSIHSISGSMTASVFTGSFKGDGSGLTNIPAGSVSGLNLSQIATGSVSASLSLVGFNVNTNTSITGSLNVTGSLLVNGTSSIVGTGTSNTIPKFTGNGTIGDSSLINDVNGNIGLGITPNTWPSGYKVIQLGGVSSLIDSFGYYVLGNNVYFDNGFKRITTNYVSAFQQGQGTFSWLTAPSESANSPVTFTQMMTLTSDGNLLIGTQVNSGYKLDVNGTSRITGDGYFTGNVGIGTASPNSILEISATTPVFRIQASDANNFHGIEFRQAAGFDAFIKHHPNSGEFRISNGRSAGWGGFTTFYTDTAERMRINSSGNVGIGTTNPGSKLSINGGNFGFNAGIGDLGNRYMVINKGTNNDGGILMQRDNSNDWQILNTSITGDLGFFSYSTSNYTFTLKRDSGNVLIGTTVDSGTKLDINPPLGITSIFHARMVGVAGFEVKSISTTTQPFMNYLFNNGNLGIGATPTSRLEVGAGDIKLSDLYKIGWRYTPQDSNMYNWIENSYSSGIIYKSGSWTSATTIASHDFQTYAGGSWQSRLRIIQNGNILIGTSSEAALSGTNGILIKRTNPAISLSSGDSPTTSWLMYRLDSDSSLRLFNGADRMMITSSGNLLIGTATNNGFKLQVNGNASFSGTSNTVHIFSDNNSLCLGLGYQGALHGYLGGISNRLEAYSNNGGYVFLNASSVWVAASDKNRKRNFEDYNLGLDAILKLQPKHYHMDFQEDSDTKQIGLIAQDVKEFIPYAYEEDQKFIGLNYNAIIVTLINAIKDLKSELDQKL